ncbi:zinc metalloprotease HtpX [Fangia hongkongensis]|uniref:zinc metalloprotease HtpX n=1 Tax=Fangia hongkongensis TaxID=270495 RepID=UPI00035D6FBB|nr:zinc metalloprotease HtpX [Fangia hongkongensis]MBK2126278.1 zinc metalloprotease HtpX [Fangia hongkongensis]
MLDIQSMDWREVVRKNTRKSYIVIALFLIIFFALGLLIDVIWRYTQITSYYPNYTIPFSAVFCALITLKIVPWATIISSAIALIWLLVTFSYYDKIMLAGTEYHEIHPGDPDPLCQRIYNVTEEMKIAANMPFIPKVYIIEANYMNAFASGFSEKSSMVAVTRALAQKLNREELQAVMAHELTHIRNQDIKLNLFTIVLSNMLMFMIEFLFWSLLFGGNRSNRRDNNNGNNVMAIIFMVVMILRFILPIITSMLMLFLSRTREYMADAGAVELMRDNRPMANALIKISENHAEPQTAQSYKQTANERMRRASYLYDPASAKFAAGNMEDMFSTHPSLKKRLASIGAILKK